MTYLVELIRYGLLIAMGLLGLSFLIFFHEFGHFLFCKLFGVSTPSFSIGFGPKLFSRKIGETEFSLSAIPFGGYVETAGLEEVGQGEQKEAKRDDKHSFNRKPYYQKLLVLSGGIIFNLIFAYITLMSVYFVGMPKIALLYPEDQQVIVKNVTENSAAAQGGVLPGDKITNLIYVKNEGLVNEQINNIGEFVSIVKENPRKKVTLLIERNGQKVNKDLIITEKDNQGVAGVEFNISADKIPTLAPLSLIDSIKGGFKATNTIIVKTVTSFKNLFNRSGIKSVGGPLLIIREIVKSAEKGFSMFFILLSLISVNLAVLNLIPLPIVDGGQIVVTTLETITRKSLPEKVRNVVHIVCWVLVIGLMIVLTLWDAKRILM